MVAERNLPNSSFNYAVAEISGDEEASISVSFNNSSTLPYLLSSNFNKKAAVSIDGIFAPFQSKSGESTGPNFPCLGSGDYLDALNSYKTATIPTIDDDVPTHENITDSKGDIFRSIGMKMPMYGVGFGYDVNGEITPGINSAKITSISDDDGNVKITRVSHGLAVDDIISLQGCEVSEYNVQHTVDSITSDDFTTNIEYTVDASIGNYYLISDITKYDTESRTVTIANKNDASKWKAGPVDLKWNEYDGVWTGNDYICGYLASGIIKASGRLNYTEFDIYKYGTKEYLINEIVDDGNGQIKAFVNIGHRLEEGVIIYIKESEDEPKYIGTHIVSDVLNPTAVVLDSDYEVDTFTDIKYHLATKHTCRNYDTHYELELESKCTVDANGNCSTQEEDVFIVAMKKGDHYIPVYIGHPND